MNLKGLSLIFVTLFVGLCVSRVLRRDSPNVDVSGSRARYLCNNNLTYTRIGSTVAAPATARLRTRGARCEGRDYGSASIILDPQSRLTKRHSTAHEDLSACLGHRGSQKLLLMISWEASATVPSDENFELQLEPLEVLDYLPEEPLRARRCTGGTKASPCRARR